MAYFLALLFDSKLLAKSFDIVANDHILEAEIFSGELNTYTFVLLIYFMYSFPW